MFYLEGLGTPPPDLEVDLQVWEVGKLVSKLGSWCRSLYRKVSREGHVDPEYHSTISDDAGSSQQDWVDVHDLAEFVCTPGELDLLNLKFLGMSSQEAADTLGISSDAFRQRLHNLRQKVAPRFSRRLR